MEQDPLAELDDQDKEMIWKMRYIQFLAAVLFTTYIHIMCVGMRAYSIFHSLFLSFFSPLLGITEVTLLRYSLLPWKSIQLQAIECYGLPFILDTGDFFLFFVVVFSRCTCFLISGSSLPQKQPWSSLITSMLILQSGTLL